MARRKHGGPHLFGLHDHEIIVDLFAGGGGASLGIYRATGRHPDVAVNHDPEALAMHAANHPHTHHLREDVWHVAPEVAVRITGGRPVGLLWASPDCKHHSKAKGGKPREKRVRSLAWVVVWWAAKVRPRVVLLENVEEFAHWGPLDGRGNPIKERRGEDFRRFVRRLEFYGYRVEWRELRACDFGAPTTRKRLFLVARCDGLPIAWPEPTHGPGRLPYRTAAEVIDRSIPCPSIFGRKRPLAEATLRRIAKGVMRYVVNNPEPFVVKVNHTGSTRQDFRGQSAEEPLRTITARHGYAVVSPTLVRQNFGERGGDAQGVGDPLHTVTTQGNRFALVSAFLAKHYGGVVGQPLGRGVGTVTAVDHHSLVTVSLSPGTPLAAFVSRQFSNGVGHPPDEPLRTILTQGHGKSALVAAFLAKYHGTSSAVPVDTPLNTVTSRDRFGLVTVMLGGEPYAVVDIGMRMLTPRELFRAQGFGDDYVIDPVHNGKRLSKAAQVRMCGNSVVPQVAEALVRANLVGLEGTLSKAGD